MSKDNKDSQWNRRGKAKVRGKITIAYPEDSPSREYEGGCSQGNATLTSYPDPKR